MAVEHFGIGADRSHADRVAFSQRGSQRALFARWGGSKSHLPALL